jgi:thiamine-phosphate pyrophosphorylase
VITPPKLSLDNFLPALEAALATDHIASLQLRLKEADDAEILEAAKAMIPLCHEHGVPFILNDAVHLFDQLDADGLHVGQEDLEGTSVSAVREKIGREAILGITCHASPHLAMEAGEQGADYVAFGAFYPTTSKPAEKLEKWGTPTPDILEDWSSASTLPCVAIGGITPENAKPLIDAGADFIAVITGIWNHPQGPAAGVNAYADVLNAQG